MIVPRLNPFTCLSAMKRPSENHTNFTATLRALAADDLDQNQGAPSKAHRKSSGRNTGKHTVGGQSPGASRKPTSRKQGVSEPYWFYPLSSPLIDGFFLFAASCQQSSTSKI